MTDPTPPDRRPSDPPLGELALVRAVGERIQSQVAAWSAAKSGHRAAVVPFGDDMAPVDPADPSLLWTTDMLMDGVDFDAAIHHWRDIGWKAMAVSLSDCAAMAAKPLSALAAVCLPRALPGSAALELVGGMMECAEQHGCALVGGDTNYWDRPAVIAVTVAARSDPGCAPVRRDGAQAGDRIFVSGNVGGSILGRHLHPIPRIELACELCRHTALHAMIDISDGLSLDLSRVLDASKRGAILERDELERIIHPDARQLAQQDAVSALDHALGDGEDFELIVVVPPSSVDACLAAGLLPIGTITATPGMQIHGSKGSLTPLSPRGWEHGG